MKIKKLGHCCLVIETKEKRIMTDPGSYTTKEQSAEENIDVILITHEHPDHFHLESLRIVLEKNSNATIITNQAVGKLLDEAGIKYLVLENKITKEVLGVEIEAHDCKHEEIFKEVGQVQNTAFFIDKRLFYPGDAFYYPDKPVDILAWPVAGPWTKVKDSMDYVLKIKPNICFPVHDGMLRPNFGTCHRVPTIFLPQANIIFKSFEDTYEEEF